MTPSINSITMSPHNIAKRLSEQKKIPSRPLVDPTVCHYPDDQQDDRIDDSPEALGADV